MARQELSVAQRVAELRQRYVSNAVSTPPIVVAEARGARVTDADGTTFIDFAGGVGCQNFGHNPSDVVRAIHEQADRYLHQCFMVAMYEPYVEVCRHLAELSPCWGEEQKSLLVNSGAEAVENAVKVARAKTGRPAVIAFDRAFHGRTLMALALTGNMQPYKQGFGPYAPEVYRVAAPYPYRDVTSDDAMRAIEQVFKADVDPGQVACMVLEPVQGEGGVVPMPPDFPPRLKALCERHGILYVDDEVQAGMGRTGPVWAIEHYDVKPDLLVSGKSLGGGLPLAAVTGPAELMDAVPSGSLGGTFGGNPLSCAAAIPVLETVAKPEFRRRAERLGERLRGRLDEIAQRQSCVGEVRGLGPMLGLELVSDPATKQPSRELAYATTRAGRERGLILISCGLDGNVIRILVPLVIEDDDLKHGCALLEAALEDAARQQHPRLASGRV